MGIDAHDRTQRDKYIYGYAAKSSRQLQVLIIHIKAAYRPRGDIEDNLSIGNKLLGNFNTRKMGIDAYIRRAITVHYPLIEGAE
jgi:hypothetical protein